MKTKDRSHYRLMSSVELIEEAKHYPNAELCIVLAERLEKTKHQLECARYDDEAERYNYGY